MRFSPHLGADVGDDAVGAATDADAGEAGTESLPPLEERRVRGTACVSHTNDCSANPPNTAPLTTATPPTTRSSKYGSPLSIWKLAVPAEPRCMPASAPPKPAIAAEMREHRELGREQVHAEGRARGRAVAHRHEAAAETPAPERDDAEPDDAEQRGDEEEVRGVGGEVDAEERERLVEPEPEDRERRDARRPAFPKTSGWSKITNSAMRANAIVASARYRPLEAERGQRHEQPDRHRDRGRDEQTPRAARC